MQLRSGDPVSKILCDRILNLGPLHIVKKHMYTNGPFVSFLNSLTGLLAMLS